MNEFLARRKFMHTVAHVVLTCIMAWFAYVFLDDHPTFVGNRSFDYFAMWGTEQQWGVSCLAASALGVASFRSPFWKIECFGASVLASMHGVFAILFFIGNPHGTAVAPYAGYAIIGASLAYSTAYNGKRGAPHLEPDDTPG